MVSSFCFLEAPKTFIKTQNLGEYSGESFDDLKNTHQISYT